MIPDQGPGIDAGGMGKHAGRLDRAGPNSGSNDGMEPRGGSSKLDPFQRSMCYVLAAL